MFEIVSKLRSTSPRFAKAVVICSLLPLGACAELIGGPEGTAVGKLARKGFKITSDGRQSEAPTAMRYSGDPAGIIICSGSGSSASAEANQAATIKTEDGLTGSQSGHVDAYVIVDNDGSLRGLYHNQIVREVRTSSGRVVGRQIDFVKFPPGGTGRFRNGVECQASL